MKKKKIIEYLSTLWEIRNWGLTGQEWDNEMLEDFVQKLKSFNFTFKIMINKLLLNSKSNKIIIDSLTKLLSSIQNLSNFLCVNSSPPRKPNTHSNRLCTMYDGLTIVKAEPLIKKIQRNAKTFYSELLKLISNRYKINNKIIQQYRSLENDFDNLVAVKYWLVDLFESTKIINNGINL